MKWWGCCMPAQSDSCFLALLNLRGFERQILNSKLTSGWHCRCLLWEVILVSDLEQEIFFSPLSVHETHKVLFYFLSLVKKAKVTIHSTPQICWTLKRNESPSSKHKIPSILLSVTKHYRISDVSDSNTLQYTAWHCKKNTKERLG